MRLAVVLDCTAGVTAAAERQARALRAFLREGLSFGSAPPEATGGQSQWIEESLVFYAGEADRDRLVALAPTRDVRLFKTVARKAEAVVGILSTMHAREEVSLFVFAGGVAGVEEATRLALRTEGAVVTGVLTVELDAARAVVRRNVYSGHMVGRYELTGQPWCVCLDASWGDAHGSTGIEHRVLSDVDESATVEATLLEEIESIDMPRAADLEEARFLVVAGDGAGSRAAVDRIAAAARDMGAGFGATRPVVTKAWAPMDRLVGVSGARTAPAFCLVAGASGSPAFHWGIERAEIIAAVNVDEWAPSTRNADVVVFGDAVTFVEELAAVVRTHRMQG